MAEVGDKIDLGIDEGEMKTIVAKFILDKLPDEQRDALLAKTLTYLVEPRLIEPRMGYGKVPGPSFLEESFKRAAEQALNHLVLEMVKNNEYFMDKLTEMVGQAMTDALKQTDGAYDLRQTITDSLARSFVDLRMSRH